MPDDSKKKVTIPPSQVVQMNNLVERYKGLGLTKEELGGRNVHRLSIGDTVQRLGSGSFSIPLALDPERQAKLEGEIRELRDKVTAQARALASAKESESKLVELQSTLKALGDKQQIAFLLDRVGTAAGAVLLSSENLRAQFLLGAATPIYAMSVDIRRSTELMLKARSPQAFARFVTELCDRLMDVVKERHGVVDKFTGDGILAFFPEFFSGPDAGYLAVAAATECHKVFATHYRNSRSDFQAVLKDVGLGIGIDYGDCHLVQVAGTLTIVGAPVVYACRLGGGPAGRTLLNQPAYERVSRHHGQQMLFSETSLDIKHEGELVAYEATLNAVGYAARAPEWLGPNFQAAAETPRGSRSSE